jgi:hypothetical protein
MEHPGGPQHVLRGPKRRRAARDPATDDDQTIDALVRHFLSPNSFNE